MGRKINAARTVSGNVPRITSRKYANGATFKEGALLVLTNGVVDECAADPTKVTCVAAEGADTRPGYQAANSPSVVTGTVQEVSAYDANDDTIFSMRGQDGGGDNAIPAQTDIGVSYGVVKVGNDWILDKTETTAKVFTVVDIDIDQKIFFCKFIASVQSLP